MEYNLKDKYILQLNEKEKALETRDLNIFYGEKQALFDGNLQFERYKITSLIRCFRIWKINFFTLFKSYE